eukprot:SAG31_NODE_476_length_15154_cov_24.796878_8_plen_215_part_00
MRPRGRRLRRLLFFSIICVPAACRVVLSGAQQLEIQCADAILASVHPPRPRAVGRNSDWKQTATAFVRATGRWWTFEWALPPAPYFRSSPMTDWGFGGRLWALSSLGDAALAARIEWQEFVRQLPVCIHMRFVAGNAAYTMGMQEGKPAPSMSIVQRGVVICAGRLGLLRQAWVAVRILRRGGVQPLSLFPAAPSPSFCKGSTCPSSTNSLVLG